MPKPDPTLSDMLGSTHAALKDKQSYQRQSIPCIFGTTSPPNATHIFLMCSRFQEKRVVYEGVDFVRASRTI